MASPLSSRAARLARLTKLVQPDLAALPDRSTPSSDPEPTLDDNDTSGGVYLLPPSNITPAPPPPPAPSVKAPAPVTSPSPDENHERRFVWKQGAVSSHNLGSMPDPVVPLYTAVKLPSSTLQKSQLSPEKSFAPIQALAKFPYKYCNRDHSQDIASGFFDAGKFWGREWDLYYVWNIEESKPLILVSEGQFQNLINDINSGLNLSLRITDSQREDGLVGRFPDHPRCQPRYLGRSHSREDYNNLIDNVPASMVHPAGEPARSALDDEKLQAFKEMIEDMWEATKAKSKATKEKKKVERLAKQKVFTDQFKRAQRYLGLRPVAQKGATIVLESIDESSPAPHSFDQSVVFVCVDVESYERAHDKITEIGIATLDTRHLVGVPPGKDGENWRSKIHARHFRIEEYAHLINSDFVSGCPDRFDFGTSERVKLREAPALVETCFYPPFCGPGDATPGSEPRNLIFLGHDTLGDVKYLQMLGFDPLTLKNLLESQDTATMYRVWRRELNPTNLGKILYDFDIPGFNLHNAGNDAMFTMQAMLGICVREATTRGTDEFKAKRDELKETKAALLVMEAKERAADEAEGWSDYEADGDGGKPVPIVIREKEPLKQSAASNGAGRGGRGGSSSTGGRGRGDHSNGGSQRQNQSGRGSPPKRGDGRGRGGSRGGGRGRGARSPSAPGPEVKFNW